MEQESKSLKKKRPLELNWDTLLNNDAPPPELVVKPMASDGESLDCISDQKLLDSIRSKKDTLVSFGLRLNDGGAKIRATIKRYEDELARRKRKPVVEEVIVHDDDDDDKPRHATRSSDVGVSSDLRQDNVSSQVPTQSSFASCFVKKMEVDADCTTVEAFGKEMSHFKHCNKQAIQVNGDSKGGEMLQSSRKSQFQCPSNLSKRGNFNDDKSCRSRSNFSLRNIRKTLSRSFVKVYDKMSSLLFHFTTMHNANIMNSYVAFLFAFSSPGRKEQASQPDCSRSRKGQPIVLDVDDDDDDDKPCVPEKIEKENGLSECMKDAKIYYPSRDDPECVEICYSDIDCLAPGSYLTSTIMNFYIRYLKQQASLTNRSLSDYHFFNTYFYKKLQEAVSCKQSDRESFFAKFRRWWKGVNMFQKAYILIPIHEDLHWSLIIICIPDKEDEPPPIILHLDSLSLHSSRSLFDSIKSYLVEERNYLDREGMSSDVLIADKIWKWLPRRIESQVITVPQQKNEYDCGLFVLYFIERFIEEAPERLKKEDLDKLKSKDLDMFGRRWFKPEEASGLRTKIHKLLVEELKNSISHKSTSESSPSSPDDIGADCIETLEDYF